MDKVLPPVPPRRAWLPALLHALPQHPPPNSWLECTVTVYTEPPCPLGSRASAMMQLLLACWELERETLSGKARASHKENVSQHSRTPHPLTLITKSPSLAASGAEVGAECWDRCLAPLQKAALSLRHTVFQFFFICITKWVFKRKNGYVNHKRARRKESINLMVNSQILKNYFKYYMQKTCPLFLWVILLTEMLLW